MPADILPRVTLLSSFDGASIAVHSLGRGEGIVVVGGSLRCSADYFAFARALAQSFTVHVIDRRGRGESSAQGDDYSIEVECRDLLAVLQATGTRLAFGHSYGGLVCLETALMEPAFDALAVFEPGVSFNGSMPTEWLPRFRSLLDQGDDWGAMVCMVQGGGFAPRVMANAPFWLGRLLLHAGMSRREWLQIRPLLRTHQREVEQIARLEGENDRYGNIECPVLLMGGANSPKAIIHQTLNVLNKTMQFSDTEIFDDVGHTGPDREVPSLIARRVEDFFLTLRRSDR